MSTLKLKRKINWVCEGIHWAALARTHSEGRQMRTAKVQGVYEALEWATPDGTPFGWIGANAPKPAFVNRNGEWLRN